MTRRVAKSLCALAAIAAFAAPAAAQMVMPRISPKATLMQRVGVTDVTVDYHRPGVKGRKIWGDLVPYGEVWRVGANERTTIEFSTGVTVGGKQLPAARYGLMMIPGEEQWTVVLSKEPDAWGAFTYDEASDAHRFPVTPRRAPATEWMDFDFENLTHTSADLVLRWAELAVPLRIETDTDRLVVGGMGAALFGAADYCAEAGGCYDVAEPWADNVVDANPSFWSWRLKARVHARQERWSDAVAAAEKALAAAEGMASPPPESYVTELRSWIADWKQKG